MVRLLRLFRKESPPSGPVESSRVQGELLVILTDSEGQIKPRMPGLPTTTGVQLIRNSVTQFQRTLVFSYLGGANAAVLPGAPYFGVGDGGATAAASANTALSYERGARIYGTFSYASPNATYGMLCTFPANNPATQYLLNEVGMFSTITSTVATCAYRAAFGTVLKQTTDILQFAWVITTALDSVAK